MEKVLVDTCIFIDIFRGNRNLYKTIINLDASFSSIVYMELIQGARNKKELDIIERFLNKFKIVHIDDSISKKSIDLLKKYSKSYGLIIPDTIIAATAMIKKYRLWTLNTKDFNFIDNLMLFNT